MNDASGMPDWCAYMRNTGNTCTKIRYATRVKDAAGNAAWMSSEPRHCAAGVTATPGDTARGHTYGRADVRCPCRPNRVGRGTDR